MTSTKATLIEATADLLRTDGLAGVAARPIAARAGVNQALIFYHFAGVADLVDVAVRRCADESIAGYRDDFDAVRSMTDLLDLGRRLHARELETGNVAIMAQVMAGAQHDDALAVTARYAVEVWTAAVGAVVDRVLVGSPLADLAEPRGLTHAVVAAFLGLELYDGVDHDGAQRAFASLEALGVLVEVLDDLGPIGRGTVRATLRRRRRARP